ncbi:hypothetical protein T310_9996 [Rasamsonia emersonii CBS 393.64]|uniref:Uncharacterized protein n=1 Tax=Rasamsonia emersonii (strain ATCC 16479 / CBS 393.64 / IMI 116815) TaxID=1408163 RepID=A0A0F4YE58_RASE3|nr:hypothetical protein T310_9996 [Rasamsonia emersonii CBS 393.64]KKA16425.1 hypothetical protein T310_9996 [Rasamsonia emersonii CBS 393.64]
MITNNQVYSVRTPISQGCVTASSVAIFITWQLGRWQESTTSSLFYRVHNSSTAGSMVLRSTLPPTFCTLPWTTEAHVNKTIGRHPPQGGDTRTYRGTSPTVIR